MCSHNVYGYNTCDGVSLPHSSTLQLFLAGLYVMPYVVNEEKYADWHKFYAKPGLLRDPQLRTICTNAIMYSRHFCDNSLALFIFMYIYINVYHMHLSTSSRCIYFHFHFIGYSFNLLVIDLLVPCSPLKSCWLVCFSRACLI